MSLLSTTLKSSLIATARVASSRVLLPATFTAARRTIHQAVSASNIEIGNSIPAHIPVFDKTPSEAVNLTRELQNKKALLIGVPGAFSPTCTEETVANYVKLSPYFVSKGFNELIFISVNDPFVMSAWRDSLGIVAHHSNVAFLSDPMGKFISQLGMLTEDAIPFFGSPRSKRFVIAVDDGRVVAKFVESDSRKCDETSPERVLKELPGLD